MPKRYSIGPLLAAMLLLIGCGGTATAPKNLSGAGSANQLSVSSAVQFGAVPVGGTSSGSLVVSNRAADGASITVSQIRVIGPGFRPGSMPSLPIMIGPGESVTLGIEFSPLSAGSAKGNVSITSDADNSVVPVPLTGSGNSGTQIGVSPSTLNFGTVAVGDSAVLNGTLTAGTSSVTISTVSQSGQGYSLAGISFPVTLGPGQQLPFSVTFTPQAAGTISGSLSFVTDASTSPTASLMGAGAQGSAHSVMLSWSASTSPILGYNIYRSQQSGGPYVKVTASPDPATTFADESVQSGATYYYVATSVSAGLQESGFSNQTVATVP